MIQRFLIGAVPREWADEYLDRFVKEALGNMFRLDR